MRGEELVEERAWAAGAEPLDGLWSAHAKSQQDEAGDQGRAIESHSAVRQDALAGLDEPGAEISDGIQLRQVGKVLVEDREVNVKHLVRNGRDAVIEAAVEIDHRVDAALLKRCPVVDGRRDEERAGVIDLIELHLHQSTDGRQISHSIMLGKTA